MSLLRFATPCRHRVAYWRNDRFTKCHLLDHGKIDLGRFSDGSWGPERTRDGWNRLSIVRIVRLVTATLRFVLTQVSDLTISKSCFFLTPSLTCILYFLTWLDLSKLTCVLTWLRKEMTNCDLNWTKHYLGLDLYKHLYNTLSTSTCA